MTRDNPGDATAEWVRREAKEAVGNRVASMSAAIWLGGVTILYLLVFLPQHLGTAQTTLFALALFLPAAVPWLFYRRLLAGEIERRSRQLRDRQQAVASEPDRGAG